LSISMLARTSPYSPPIFLGWASFGIVVERKLEEGVFVRLAIDRTVVCIRLHKDNRFPKSRPCPTSFEKMAIRSRTTRLCKLSVTLEWAYISCN
jgi:hypothetical protein